MAGNITQKYGTPGTLTITIASLANAGARQSTVVDNTVNLFQEVLIFLKIKSAAASTSATGVVNIYAFGSVDSGTTYSENAGSSDAGITLTSPPNVRLIGTINVVANSTTYYSPLMSLAAAFGGTIPDHWGIIIENKTSATLDATGGSHAALYEGLYSQYT